MGSVIFISLLSRARFGNALISRSFGSRRLGATSFASASTSAAGTITPINNIRWRHQTSPLSVVSHAKRKASSLSASPISISDEYDSGNGEFVSCKIEDGEECDISVNVRIKPDPYTDLEGKQHFQYFSFRSTLNYNSPALSGIFSNKKSLKVKYILQNAGEASYADAFNGYSTFVSTKSTPFDPDSWTRTRDSSYANGCLTWSHVHDLEDGASSPAVFAYFPPYSYVCRDIWV